MKHSVLQASMPELPSGKRRRYAELGLPPADVLLLTDDVSTAAYFEEVLAAGAPPKPAANWILGDVLAHCNVRLPNIYFPGFRAQWLRVQLIASTAHTPGVHLDRLEAAKVVTLVPCAVQRESRN